MKIIVGKVLKAQGIKGEIKISCLLDHSKQFSALKDVYVGETLMQIESIRVENEELLYIKLAQVPDRNTAETLRGLSIYAEKDDIKLEKGKYFIDDLIGCQVLTEKGEIGKLIEISPCKSADVFTCKVGEKTCSFPFLKSLIVEVNVGEKKIVLDEKGLSEVIVYEN